MASFNYICTKKEFYSTLELVIVVWESNNYFNLCFSLVNFLCNLVQYFQILIENIHTISINIIHIFKHFSVSTDQTSNYCSVLLSVYYLPNKL